MSGWKFQLTKRNKSEIRNEHRCVPAAQLKTGSYEQCKIRISYLALHCSKIFKRVAKSLHPPTCEASSWCWSSASFCFWGSPEKQVISHLKAFLFIIIFCLCVSGSLSSIPVIFTSVSPSTAAFTALPSTTAEQSTQMLLNLWWISSVSTRDEEFQSQRKQLSLTIHPEADMER